MVENKQEKKSRKKLIFDQRERGEIKITNKIKLSQKNKEKYKNFLFMQLL